MFCERNRERHQQDSRCLIKHQMFTFALLILVQFFSWAVNRVYGNRFFLVAVVLLADVLLKDSYCHLPNLPTFAEQTPADDG